MPLQCEDSSSVNGDEDRFLTMNNVKFPFSPKESKLQAAEECKLACFNDCACNAYAYNGTAVCSNTISQTTFGDLLSLTQLSEGDPDGQTLYLKLAASEFQNHGGNFIQREEVIAIVVVVAILLPASYIVYKEDSKRKVTALCSSLSLVDLMDPILENEASFSMLIRYINVALLCVQEIVADRPTMSEVVSMLTNEHIVLPSPKQPAFSYVRSLQNPFPPKHRPEVCSVNNVTVSLIESR
ncbi:hypothetical protein JRO89_XS15G0136000 [Xanthoceras sorbifolium]|uniref:Apple domain-containing protein n=1 Tax=Xanthoceras sorbifolium TaxID=99658 RepID=A0ABQ8H217_9ROSI|nr:hypothetical protein JRO89_XS15G0136000 [Xanthoceras sorbifolium]